MTCIDSCMLHHWIGVWYSEKLQKGPDVMTYKNGMVNPTWGLMAVRPGSTQCGKLELRFLHKPEILKRPVQWETKETRDWGKHIPHLPSSHFEPLFLCIDTLRNLEYSTITSAEQTTVLLKACPEVVASVLTHVTLLRTLS